MTELSFEYLFEYKMSLDVIINGERYVREKGYNDFLQKEIQLFDQDVQDLRQQIYNLKKQLFAANEQIERDKQIIERLKYMVD